jgi:transcriptional regulator with XRE-family HTH domain
LKGNHLVREARKRAGLSQAELARRVGTTQSVISRLERGATAPSMQTISDLLRACGFDLEVRVVPHDDSDWSLVQQNLRLSPSRRVGQLARTVRFIQTARQAERSGAGGT